MYKRWPPATELNCLAAKNTAEIIGAKADGEGYRFFAAQVLHLDKINSQIAARLVGAFNRWKKYDSRRQELMRKQLEIIIESPGLSSDVYEIVSKALQG